MPWYPVPRATTSPVGRQVIASELVSFSPSLELLRERLMPVGDRWPLDRGLCQMTLERDQILVPRVGVELLHAADLVTQAIKEDLDEPPILLCEVRVCAE